MSLFFSILIIEFFKKIIEENMDLTKITMKEIDGHLTELGVIDSKDFVIKALSENISEIQKKFNKIEEENQDLKLMVTDFKKKNRRKSKKR